MPVSYTLSARTCGDCGRPFVPTSGTVDRAANWYDGCREDGADARAEMVADRALVESGRAEIRRTRRGREFSAFHLQQARRRSAQRV